MLTKIISLILLLSCSVANATFTPSGSATGLGSASGSAGSDLFIPINNPDGFITLYALASGNDALNSCSPFLKYNGSAYQVPSGKTFRTVRTVWQSGGAAGSNMFQFMSGTTTFPHGTATGSVTGIVYQSTVANQTMISVTGVGAVSGLSLQYEWSQNTWPGIQIGNLTGSGFVAVIGRETTP